MVEVFNLNDFKTKPPNEKDWQRFVKEGLVNFDGKTNVKYEFSKMCKIFGLSYIYYLEIQYKTIDIGGFDLQEFQDWNGNVPLKFIEKFK